MFKKIKSSILYRIIIGCSVILLITVIVLFSAMIYMYSKSTTNTINTLSQKILNQSKTNMLYMDDLAKNLTYLLYFDQNIYAYTHESNEDINGSSKAVSSMLSTLYTNAAINSAVIYNSKLGTFISSYSTDIYNKDNFSDRSIVDMFTKKADRPEMLVPYARTVNNRNVYSYFLYETDPQTGEIDSAIVLNMNINFLSDTVASIGSDFNSSDVMIVDKKGLIINYNNNIPFLTNVSDRDYIKKVLISNEDFGTFQITINKLKYLVTYGSIPQLGWKLVALIPYGDFFRSVSKTFIIMLSVGIIVLIIGLLLTFLVAKSIFSPYTMLLRNIKRKTSGLSKIDSDDVVFLTDTFNEMSSNLDSFGVLSKVKPMKTVFYEHLLTVNQELSLIELENMAKNVESNLLLDMPLMILIAKIDKFADYKIKHNQEERNLLSFAIGNITNELMSEYNRNEFISLSEELGVIILNVYKEEDIDEKIIPIINKIQDNVKLILDISLTVTVSYITGNASKLSELYKYTSDLSMYRICLGHEAVITQKDIIKNIENEDFGIPPVKERQLIECIKSGETESAAEAYMDISGILKNYKYENIMSSIIYLAFTINNSFRNAIENKTGTLLSEFNDFITNIKRKETLDEINNEFINLIDTIIYNIKIEKAKANKTDTMILNAVALINNNYSDLNLCLNSIAEVLNVSPAYLGRKFKEVQNESIAKYIQDIRMEKLLHLIETTNLDLSEIVARIGLEKSNYLYALFKKYYGISIAAYRQEVINKKIERTGRLDLNK